MNLVCLRSCGTVGLLGLREAADGGVGVVGGVVLGGGVGVLMGSGSVVEQPTRTIAIACNRTKASEDVFISIPP